MANILVELQKFSKLDGSFSKKEFSKNIDDQTMADSYIWTLQEHDLVEYDEKTDIYKINNKKISEYTPFIPDNSLETKDLIETTNKDLENDIPMKKEIIYISKDIGTSTRNIVLKGLIRKEEIFSTFEAIEAVIMDHNKILISKFENTQSDIIVELEINNDSLSNILTLLNNAEWKTQVSLDKNMG